MKQGADASGGGKKAKERKDPRTAPPRHDKPKRPSLAKDKDRERDKDKDKDKDKEGAPATAKADEAKSPRVSYSRFLSILRPAHQRSKSDAGVPGAQAVAPATPSSPQDAKAGAASSSPHTKRRFMWPRKQDHGPGDKDGKQQSSRRGSTADAPGAEASPPRGRVLPQVQSLIHQPTSKYGSLPLGHGVHVVPHAGAAAQGAGAHGAEADGARPVPGPLEQQRTDATQTPPVHKDLRRTKSL